jgi:hypothetical protein
VLRQIDADHDVQLMNAGPVFAFICLGELDQPKLNGRCDGRPYIACPSCDSVVAAVVGWEVPSLPILLGERWAHGAICYSTPVCQVRLYTTGGVEAGAVPCAWALLMSVLLAQQDWCAAP